VPEWSSRGDGVRNPDVVAPAVGIVSLRAPGSLIDERFPAARVGEGSFRGSGTSQAAAVVAGIVALLLDERPWLRPNAVKALLVSTAKPLEEPREAQGAGLVDADAALRAPVPELTRQPFAPSGGAGSLDEARGSARLAAPGGEQLAGEQDIFGQRWDARQHTVAALLGTAWRSGFWNGTRWTGTGFADGAWQLAEWSRPAWSGHAWSELAWSGRRWSGVAWTGGSWSDGWSGRRWSGQVWMAMWPGAS
jgi:serine protease AprX